MYERSSLQFLWWLLLGAPDKSETKHVNQPSLSTSAGLEMKKGAYGLRSRARALRNGVERRLSVPRAGRILLMESE